MGEHYDYLAPNASAAYAWDAPTSAVKVLQLEFEQGSRWEQREYGLEELKRHNRVKLSRALPDLSFPLFEGYLDLLRPQSETWERVLGVLKGPTLYVFTDEHKLHLRAIINLSIHNARSHDGATGLGGGGKSKKQPSITQHKAAVTVVFSILKSNFDRTTAKLNTLLLTTEDIMSSSSSIDQQAKERYLVGRELLVPLD